MESQLSGQKVSVMPYTCHNSDGQVLKRLQIEIELTAPHNKGDCATIPATRRGVRSRKNV
ncbi:hypothetical protein T07_13526 [Trichinella nelsoni]|uniref:Uncharacterized protein n=1 Tax=Trichinella nelsoni TaxID=6336 RepID=A0A0V0RHS0_9BILA|nr:hypothetical protein T07_13526 [Trichinella nelsoni]